MSIFTRPRLQVVVGVSAAFGLLLGLHGEVSLARTLVRAILMGLAILWIFGLLERRPKRLPRWLSRTALQIAGVVLVVPFAAMLAYGFTGGDSASPHHGAGMQGLIAVAMLFAPWIAIAAIFRQRELERGALERRALDARLRLLQSQIEPHFLFNTLANVQALVETQSPQAPKVLASLIAYLRAAVPRMEEESSTLEREVELVRAYLELMQMRIPDRLQYALHVDPAALRLQCPPVTLLTLVENAVRHGIDPGETGGRIDVHVWVHSGRCNIEVIDTGLGLRSQNPGLGTGLSNLRERLQLTFGNDVELKLVGISPHGVSAALSFPARKEGA